MSKSVKSTHKRSASKSNNRKKIVTGSSKKSVSSPNKKSSSSSNKKSPSSSNKKTASSSNKKTYSSSNKSVTSTKIKSTSNKKLASPHKTVQKKISVENSDDIFDVPDVIKKGSTDSPSESSKKQIEKIRTALEKNYTEQKKLMYELDKLMSQQNNKNIDGDRTNRINSGNQIKFESEPVPQSLKKLLKIETESMPRYHVVKLLHEYLMDNKLCDKKTKQIIPNKKLIDVFKMEESDTINYYNLQSWLKKVYCENINQDN